MVRDVNREPLLFLCGTARVKNIRYMLRDVNWEPLAFCMRRYLCKKHKIDIKGHQSGAPCFLYVALLDVKGRQLGAPYFLYVLVH